MKLALVFNKHTAEQLKASLKDVQDNIQSEQFDDTVSFIQTSINRSKIFDRVIIQCNLAPEEVWEDLNNFWADYCPQTKIIILGRKNRDEAIAKKYTKLYPCEDIVFVLPLNINSATLGELICATPTTLRGAVGFPLEVVSSVDAIAVEPIEEVQETQPEQTDLTASQEFVGQEPQPEFKNEPKKRGGFLSRLFGGKKGNTQEPAQPIETPSENTQIDTPKNQNFVSSDSGETYQAYEELVPNKSASTGSQNENSETNDIWGMENGSSDGDVNSFNPFSEDAGVSGEGAELECSSVEQTVPDDLWGAVEDSSTEQQSEADPFGASDGFTATDANEFQPFDEEPTDAYEPFNEGASEDEPEQVNPFGSTSEVENPFGDTSDTFEPKQEATQPEVSNHFEPQQSAPEEVNIDIFGGMDDGDSGFAPVEEPVAQNVDINITGNMFDEPAKPEKNITNVDMNIGGDLAQEEDAYRAKVEAPKTIIKEVEKIVEAPALGKDLLKSLTKGKKNVLLIVTGDRGSGITSTARLIAEKTASLKIDTLLVDMDVDLHGILSYINYDDYASSTESITNGVKGLKKAKYLANSIYELGNNLGLISSNYDIDVTEDDIEQAQDVLEECLTEFGVVIVDCPLDKLKYIPELLIQGTTCLCVECSKRGFMNMLCRMSTLDLPKKQMRKIASTGKILVTKITKAVSPDKVIKQMNAIYEPEDDDIDWLRIPYMAFDGKVDNKVLAKILGV